MFITSAKPNIDKPRISCAEAAGTFCGWPIPIKDQEKTLSLEDLSPLEEMVLCIKCKLRFSSIHFRPPMLVVNCMGVQTADWPKKKSSRLSIWKGVEIRACVGENISKAPVVTIFFLRSKELLTPGKLHLWRVQGIKDECLEKLLIIGVDERSASSMKK